MMLLNYPLNAGELIKAIAIEDDVGDTFSDSGEHVEEWQEFLTARAAIRPLSGRELERALQIQPDVTHKVTIRYRSGITTKMRILYGTRYFNILSVIDREEMKTALDILCRERT